MCQPDCLKYSGNVGRFPSVAANFSDEPFPVTPFCCGYNPDINAARDGPHTGN